MDLKTKIKLLFLTVCGESGSVDMDALNDSKSADW